MDLLKPWEKARKAFMYPALKKPKLVEKLEGGACYNFRNNETLMEEKFIRDVVTASQLPEEEVIEGISIHEIGHYMVYPRTLSVLIFAAKMVDDFFKDESRDTKEGILQTYADMANDTASVLAEDRTGPILNLRAASQEETKEKMFQLQKKLMSGKLKPKELAKTQRELAVEALNLDIREVMLAYLMHQAERPHEIPEGLQPFLDRMLEIDFQDLDITRTRLNVWTFGNIIIDLLKKHGCDKGSGNGSVTGKLIFCDHNDSDVFKIMREATGKEIKEALRQLASNPKISKKEFEKIRDWMKTNGANVPKRKGPLSIGTSEGKLEVDMNAVEYYDQISRSYSLVIAKKPMDTKGKIRVFSETRKWRPGQDPNLVLPFSSQGKFLPGVTRSIRITERPIRTTAYATPHTLIIVDSSGSMPDPAKAKSYAAIGGICAARSHHVNGSYAGVVNFSGGSFYLPYTRDLKEAMAAIVAYQGGGTVVDIEMIRKMLGPEIARLYELDPTRDIRGVPKEAVKKNVSIGLSEEVFRAEHINVIMFTDGGIANLNETLELFEEKAEINRATIVLTHHFDQTLNDFGGGKIRVFKIDDEKDIPHIVIADTADAITSLSWVTE